MPKDLTPFPKPGKGFVGEPVLPVPAPSIKLQLRRREEVALGLWCGCLFAVSLAATLVIVHHAVALVPTHNIRTSYLVDWGLATGGALLLLAVLGGVFVFGSGTAWHRVLLLSLLGGPAVALGYWFGISGQMETGSALCGPSGGCDILWGFGAAALAIPSAVALATVFTSAFSLKMIARRRHT